MKKLTQKVEKEIIAYIENHQPQVDWGNDFDKDSLVKILENGMDDYTSDLYEYNLDYICELEDYLIKDVQENWPDYDEDQIEDLCKEYVCIDMNLKNLPGIGNYV